jgi:Na+/phosphate symporter
MVAMGSSLADKAWGSESAVYRVAGVLNVIGGWFFTAIIAFFAASILAYVIHLGGPTAIGILLFIAIVLLSRNYINHKKKAKEEKAEDRLLKAESSSIQGVIEESASNISNLVRRGNKIFSNTIDALGRQDVVKLKKSRKGIDKLDEEVNELRDNIFYFIKNLDEASVGASQFYIKMLGYLQDMTQSIEFVAKASHKHVNNKHKSLRFNQIKDLKEIDDQLTALFNKIEKTFDAQDFSNLPKLINEKQELFKSVESKIDKQISRTRTEESSPKNTALYFSLLLETKDLIHASMNLLEIYDIHHTSNNKIL